jgi:hypothetical protein
MSSVLVLLKLTPSLVWVSERSTVARPFAMSFHRNASTSQRRAPSAALILRNAAMHHGPVAPSISMSCCATVSAIALCFLGTGGWLNLTGLVLTKPQNAARLNAEETSPATWRTVFRLGGIGGSELVAG